MSFKKFTELSQGDQFTHPEKKNPQIFVNIDENSNAWYFDLISGEIFKEDIKCSFIELEDGLPCYAFAI